MRYVEKAQGTTLSTFCIKVVSKDAIEAAFDATARMSDHDPDLGGLYVIADETILIPSDLDLTRAFDLSFVVHEVLHVYQH